MSNIYDFLVIGSGIAGLRYALDVAQHGSVLMLTKDAPDEGNTRYAQGGIASVMSPLDDSFEAHARDTLNAGAGLCDPDIVSMCIESGPAEIQRLIDLGTQFDRADTPSGFELGKEGGHSSRRILHAGDSTGAEILRSVLEVAESHPQIKILPYQFAIDLILDAKGEVVGCYSLDTLTGDISSFGARSTLIASGGAGKVYLYTSNPDVATADGVAIAYRAGAEVANMEFVQFHPTCLYHQEAKSFLITEALRGEGAYLRLPTGERFMAEYHKDEELAPRDIVARAIDDQMKRHGFDYVLLDATHLDSQFLQERFPMISSQLTRFGYSLAETPLPVVPAAHYFCGGIKTDQDGKTSLPRLYAAGEAAYTGLHGANRLASNSLLEAVVFASRAATHAIESMHSLPEKETIAPWQAYDAVESYEAVLVSYLWDEVRRITWNLVGIVRSNNRLALAQRRINYIKKEIKDYYWKFLVTKDLLELRNITEVADLMIRSAAQRKESRGLHFTIDFPTTDDANFLKPTILSLESSTENGTGANTK